MKHGNIHFNDEIKDARKQFWKAKSKYRKIIRVEQNKCKHLNSYASEWVPKTNWSGYRPAKRVCVLCGYWEEEKYWNSISDWCQVVSSNGVKVNYKFKTKFPKNGFIQTVSHNDIRKCIPTI